MQETNEQSLNNIVNIVRVGSFIVLMLHIYYFCFPIFHSFGLYHDTVLRLLYNFNRTMGAFTSIWPTKMFALLLLVVAAIGTKGKKSKDLTWKDVWWRLVVGGVLYLGSGFILYLLKGTGLILYYMYALVTVAGFLFLMSGSTIASRLINADLMKDVFNEENESFMQETRLMTNKRSINLPTQFYYKKKWRDGWINVVNPFRAIMVLGTPGSGKSYAIIEPSMTQMIDKGFAGYIYDYKFPTLTKIAYNHLRLHHDGYEVVPKFYIINFDDLERSHRCNPINPAFMTDISDAYESAYTVMMNLNRTWIKKQGDFFVESPINLLTAVIWFLKIYENGKYCTFPHAIEFLCAPYEEIFPILMAYPELENYVTPFKNAMDAGAQEQLQGQIASAQIPLSRIISPQLYWVMTGNDFTLDLNNPDEPKILCVGNNPDRQNIYGAAIGLYNSRIVKLINKPHQLQSTVIVDELPTIFLKGLDNLIATARSNKVNVLLGFQDFSQLERDYGKEESTVIRNTIGNVFAGQVVADTARTLSERFGKVLQKRESLSINRQDTSMSISTQLDSLIPASKISTLSQGQFVGAVADDFGQEIKQKIFNCKIKVDVAAREKEEKQYVDLPIVTDFRSKDKNGHPIKDKDGNYINLKDKMVNENYYQIKADVRGIIDSESVRLGLGEEADE